MPVLPLNPSDLVVNPSSLYSGPGASNGVYPYLREPFGILFRDGLYNLMTARHQDYVLGTGNCQYLTDRLTSPDGITWTISPGNPLFPVGPSGAFDDRNTETQFLIDMSDIDPVKPNWIYYAGRSYATGKHQIGLARGNADFTGFVKHNGNGLLISDPLEISRPVVVKRDGVYHMVLSVFGGSPSAGGMIRRYSSTDAINWTNHGLILTPTSGAWDGFMTAYPYLVDDVANQRWILFYAGCNAAYDPRSIGWATSPYDPVSFTKQGRLTNGYCPLVFLDNDNQWRFYCCRNFTPNDLYVGAFPSLPTNITIPLGGSAEIPGVAPFLSPVVEDLNHKLAMSWKTRVGAYIDSRGMFENGGGLQERWFKYSSYWYFILPTGEVYYAPSGSVNGAYPVFTLDSRFYDVPAWFAGTIPPGLSLTGNTVTNQSCRGNGSVGFGARKTLVEHP